MESGSISSWVHVCFNHQLLQHGGGGSIHCPTVFGRNPFRTSQETLVSDDSPVNTHKHWFSHGFQVVREAEFATHSIALSLPPGALESLEHLTCPALRGASQRLVPPLDKRESKGKKKKRLQRSLSPGNRCPFGHKTGLNVLRPGCHVQKNDLQRERQLCWVKLC